MIEKPKKLKVTFTKQQLELLDRLKGEDKCVFGKTYEEIVVNVFQDYVNQVFRGGR